MENTDKQDTTMSHLNERWHATFRVGRGHYIIRSTTGFNIFEVCGFLPGDTTGQLTAKAIVAKHNAGLLSEADRKRFQTATARLELPRKKGDVCRGVYIVDTPDGGVHYLNKDGTWRLGASDADCWWDYITQATDFLKNIRKEYGIDVVE